MIQILTSVLVITAALGALVFVVRYLATRWFRSMVGRQAMAFMTVILLVMSLAIVRQFVGPTWVGRDWVRLVSYLLINIVIWWQVVLLFAGQRRARPRRQDGDPVP